MSNIAINKKDVVMTTKDIDTEGKFTAPEIDLGWASKEELVKELKSRLSVSSVYVPEGEGAIVEHSRGKISVSGQVHILIV